MMESAFTETVDYLEALYHQPFVPVKKAELRRAAFLLNQLGNPHRAFKSVHVTGSCGKGSTTTMIGNILQQAGFLTGYFRSPHLESYRERVAVNGHEIDEQDWLSSCDRVFPIVDKMRENAFPAYDLGRPTLFEVLFALGAIHFKEHGVEWGAIETGLGGRLDATNLMQSEVAVITNVSLEHTQILGNTLEEIASEKAAIIKPGCHAVTASEDGTALSIIEARAAAQEAPLAKIGADFSVRATSGHLHGQHLEIESSERYSVALPLAGGFQAKNAATAVAAALALKKRGVDISHDAIVNGLGTVTLPGRFELVRERPLTVLDGAHNPAGMHELCKSVQALLPGKRVIVVFATMADKDVPSMATELREVSDLVIATQAPGSERAADPYHLADIFGSLRQAVIPEPDADRALELATSQASDEKAILVTGSLYLVGHARKSLATALVA